MKVILIPVTPFQQNCSLVVCEKTGRGALIDAGGEPDRLLAEAEKRNVQLEKLLVTHGHLDHCGATGELAERLSLPIEGPHEEDKFWIDQGPQSAARYGFPLPKVFTPDRWLEGGERVKVGESELEVRHCPGHTPGHIIFFSAEFRLAWVGDVLFQGSVGRSDFPRSDPDALLRSIRTQLWPLGNDVTFVPGHGPTSTFGAERKSNPFVADTVFAEH